MNQPPDIGALLRDTRSRFGWSLEDVAHRTRIPVAHLRQLEANDYTRFPSRSYARSFLAQYSEYLGIDAIEWLDSFDAQQGFATVEVPNCLYDQDDQVDAAPLLLKRKPAKTLAVRTEIRREDAAPRPVSSAAQPLLVFAVTATLITGAVFGFMKLSESLSPTTAEAEPEQTQQERLGPVSSLSASRPHVLDFSAVPRAEPVTSEDLLVAGDPTARPPEALRTTPPAQEITSADFSFDRPPPRAVIVEE